MQRTNISQNERYIFETGYTEYKQKYGINMASFLEAAIAHDSRGKLSYKDIHISVTTLQRKVWTLQTILSKYDVQKNDHIMMFIQNSIAFYGVYYATLSQGAVIIPVNTFLSDSELTHVIKDCKPKIVITLLEEKDRIDNICSSFKDIPVLAFSDTLSEIKEHETMIHPTKIHEDDCTAILYTSGTTGIPKGVMLSSKNLITNMLQTYARFFSSALGKQYTVLAALPLFHSFTQMTCVITAIFAGAHIIILPKLDRHNILDAFTSYKPTIFLGVPALFGLLCMLKKVPLDSVEFFISGGDALPNRIRQTFALLYNRKICNGYGLSEASPVIAADLSDTFSETGCVGLPLVNINIEIRDEQEKTLEQGEIGNLYVHGDNVMLGYYHDEVQTKKVLYNNWLNTGDRAYINKNGEIVIAGREKDLIVHKGFKIYPQEVEQVILMHPAITRAAVIGRTDEKMGEEYPVAFVQIRSEYKEHQENILNEIMKLCKEQLASYKVPRKIEVPEELPLTVTGKIDKKKLK